MQYFNPALLRKQADGREETMRKLKESGERIRRKFELTRSQQTDPQQNDSQQNDSQQNGSQQNDQFKPFDQLSDNYGMTDAVDDVSSWWGGQGDKATAAGNRALTYFTPRLVGSLGLAAVVSLLAGRKGGIMPALIGAVAGWFLGGPAMDFFQKTFGSKPEDVKKRTEDAKKENGTAGATGEGAKKPEGNNGQNQPQQPPQQPTPQPEDVKKRTEDAKKENGTEGAAGEGAKQPEGNNGQKQPQQPPQQPTPQPEQPAEDPQEPPIDDEEFIEEQGGEIPTTGGNPVENPRPYGLLEDDPDSGATKQPAAGQPVVEQPAEDPTAGGAPNMMGQIKGNVEAAAAGVKQVGGNMINMINNIRGKLQLASRTQNPTEARAQAQQQPQQQQPQMTAEEWQQQVAGRMSGPWQAFSRTPEMRLHDYAYNIPERTEPSYGYLGRKPTQDELMRAYPEDAVKEYATTGNPLNRHRTPADLRQEMYHNDQRGLMAGRKPQGQPLQDNIPGGKFTLKRNAVYEDLMRQYRGQPKIGPYKQ